MRIGVGLPAAIPGSDASELGEWAARAEAFGFASVGVIDRLVFGNVGAFAYVRAERSVGLLRAVASSHCLGPR